MSTEQMLAVAPFVLTIGLALAVLLVDLIWPRRDELILALGIGGVAVVLGVTFVIGPSPWDFGLLTEAGSVGDPALYTRDSLTALLDCVLLSVGLLTLLFAPDYIRPRGLPVAEFTVTLLFAVSGGMLIAGGQDLLILFIGLELLVLPGYLLAAFAKRDGLSTEGAIKYFLLGSFSSAILLFGLAFVMGFTGSTQLAGVAEAVGEVVDGTAPLPLALAMGLALLAVGALFKIAAVPFHYWTPDAYQGSPTPVTGYLSTGPKIAAFALILRILVEGLGPIRGEWALIVGVLAAVTMTVGNLAALGQDNIKRMLAYSSIAHTGYIMVGLVGFATAEDPAIAAAGVLGVLFFSVAYAFMNLGACAGVRARLHRPRVCCQLATGSGRG
jgi:NADH-quinone oxidoreductase subunit N